MYYKIKNDNLISWADYKYEDDCLYTDVVVASQVDCDRSVVLVEDGELILNPNYEEEQRQKEAERIAKLKLTRGDVFRALLQAKQVTRAQIRSQLEAMSEETPEQQLAKEMALIDFDEALDFYRGNTLIDTVGAALGITGEQLDKFFIKGNDEETKSDAWMELITRVVE